MIIVSLSHLLFVALAMIVVSTSIEAKVRANCIVQYLRKESELMLFIYHHIQRTPELNARISHLFEAFLKAK